MVYTHIEAALSSLESPRLVPDKLEQEEIPASVIQKGVAKKRSLISSKPRLSKTRDEPLEGDFEAIIEAYQEWRDFDEYVVLRKKGTDEFMAVLARKRGNRKYNRMFHAKLNSLTKSLSPKRGMKAVFITLTHEYGRYHSDPIHDQYFAWIKLGERFNRFISWIRKKYPRAAFFRVWESTEKGYPHVHLLLLNPGKIYLPQEKMNKIWGAYTWINRVRSIWGAMNYLRKYLGKTYTLDSHQLTAALLWYYRKRSFSISDSLFLYLIQEKRYSNQTTLDGEKIKEEWIFLGIMTDEEIKTNILIGDVRFV